MDGRLREWGVGRVWRASEGKVDSILADFHLLIYLLVVVLAADEI